MRDKNVYTTLSVKKITVKRLEGYGLFNETFDALLNRIMDQLETPVKQ